MSVLLGHVQNGVVILDGGVPLAEGTAVRVEPLESANQPTTDLQRQLLEWAGKGVELAPDLARRHDYYLHRQED